MSVSAERWKRCPDCGLLKSIAEFGCNASRGGGLQFYCRSCFARRSAASYRDRQRRKGKTVREKRVVPDGHKFCPACKRVLAADKWHRTRRTRDGLVSHCKDCRKVRARRDHLKRTFGLTPEALEALIESQGGVCAVCRDGEPEHIDHDHESGQVRGVLCGPCNMGLGLFKDDPSRLRSAMRYLARARLRATMHEVEHTSYVIELDSRRFHAA